MRGVGGTAVTVGAEFPQGDTGNRVFHRKAERARRALAWISDRRGERGCPTENGSLSELGKQDFGGRRAFEARLDGGRCLTTASGGEVRGNG